MRARSAPVLVLLAALAGSGAARAQEAEEPAAVARRVHEAGGYASDVTPFVRREPVEGEWDGTGAGRGPRGETSVDAERELREAMREPTPPAWLRELFDWLGLALRGVSGPLGYLLLALGLVVLVLVVAFGIASLRFRAPRVGASPRREAKGEPALDPFLVGTGESAEDLAAQGRFREAIHALFLDALREVGGAERSQRGRTARELVRAVEEGRAGARELRALLDLAELVWFGGRDATEAQYRHARELAGAVARAEGPT